MLGSETQKLLQHTTIPVLVSAVESNLPAAEIQAPLAVIRDEHRSLAAVIHGLEYLVRQARDGGAVPSFPLLRAMLHYIKAFPETLHHPKEDAYLFRKLRARTHEFDATLDELERQHVVGHAHVEELEQSIAGLRGRSGRRTRPLRGGGADLRDGTGRAHGARVQGDHSRRADAPDRGRRREIGAAFAGNSDPRFSVDNDEEFRQLFARIINLAPEPVVGQAERG